MAVTSIPCPSCRNPSPPSFRFCGACGAALERTCPACRAPSPLEFQFCGNCGARLAGVPDTATVGAASEPLVGEERKVVTVVFADLTASTELATRLDPEELRGVLRPFYDAMSEEIERFDGTVEKFIGDAVVAVFGVPIAHEDDPQRAVRAALAMQSRMATLNEELAGAAGGDLAIRIGINTGEVLAAHRTEREGFVTGEAVNLAARLQSLARSGAVVVGERTRKATNATFAYRELGENVIKGFEHPVPAWEAMPGARPSSEPRGLGSPMVGRDEELDLLRLLFARTQKQGRSNLVTVLGPPGIGKSRLAAEFMGSLELGVARVVRGRCLPYDGGLGYWPLAEILKADAGILDSDSPDTIVTKARASLDPRFVHAEEGLGTTQVLLSSIGIASGSDPLAGVEPSAARSVLAGAWRRYFESLGGERPVVVVIEDIHWADDAMLELLESLADRVAAPLFLLCMARPDLWQHRPSWGAGLPNANMIELSPLSPGEGSTLVGNLLGGEAPPDLVEQVVRRCEGNPFFTGELLRMMIEDGTLEERSGEWGVTRRLPSSLPDTVQGVIASRIDLLPAAEKRAIQDAAVVGRTFWLGAVELLGTPDAAAVVDGLIDKGLVMERPTSGIEGERELFFHHILTRDVAYGSIPRTRRADAHSAVLGWMEKGASGRDEEFAEILWYHADRAGDLERAARFAMIAGHRHRRVFAAVEAIGWYDRAVEAIGRLSSDAMVLLLVETALSRGEACEQLGRFAEAHDDYERALEAARQRPPGSREWLESRALAALVHVLWNEDRYSEAEVLLPRALEAASAQGVHFLVAQLWYTAGSMAFGQGDWARARSSHRKALEVATGAGDLEVEALARHGLTETGFFTGPFDEALSEGLEADRLLRGLGQRPMAHHNECMTAQLQWLLGDRDAAARTAESALAGCRDVGDRRDEAYALTILSMIDVSRGRLGRARRGADEAIVISAEVDSPRLELTARCWGPWVFGELGEYERVDEDVRIAREVADGLGGGFLHAPLEAAWGWALARRGAIEDARVAFARASDLAGDTALEVLWSLIYEVMCWEELGDGAALADAARRLLDAARGRSPVFVAWAESGVALACLLLGDASGAAERAARAADRAAGASEIPVAWRSQAVLARANAELGRPAEAAAAMARARTILAPIVDGVPDEAARCRFLARPDVHAVMASG